MGLAVEWRNDCNSTDISKHFLNHISFQVSWSVKLNFTIVIAINNKQKISKVLQNLYISKLEQILTPLFDYKS